MKILQIDTRCINTDHIVCYDIQQMDRDPERIITLTVQLVTGKQVSKSFYTKTYKLSRIEVESKVTEMLCDDKIGYLNFYNICTSKEKP